ncbi:MAG: TIR domain-containing protein [Magnetococcales bacterium]|nr:TIR domain-containing protein [Magnetococcales bacterium]
MSKQIFISFDFEHDRNYAFLLKAMAKNRQFKIDFKDRTPKEIQSNDFGRINAVLTQRLKEATHILVVVGKHANDPHLKRGEIGEVNWQTWELEKAKELGKGVVAVKIEPSNDSMPGLMRIGAKWAMSFNADFIAQALNEA